MSLQIVSRKEFYDQLQKYPKYRLAKYGAPGGSFSVLTTDTFKYIGNISITKDLHSLMESGKRKSVVYRLAT